MSYKTIEGRDLDIGEPSGDLGAYWRLLLGATEDPAVSHNRLIALIYSPENPLMDRDYLPGRGSVTPAVFAQPLYHAMCDLLGRKQAQTGELDLERVAATYTVTPAEASETLGISQNAVRQAVEAGRLGAWKKGGRWFLHHRGVEAYRVGHGGKQRDGEGLPLDVRIGADGRGDGMKLRHLGAALERDDGNTHAGRVAAGWARLGVMTTSGVKGGEGKARFFVLEPSSEPGELEFSGFYVRGAFKVVSHENNARRAAEAWKAFEAK